MFRNRHKYRNAPQVPHRQEEGEDLAQDSGQRRAEHAPVEGKDEDGVQDGVGDGSRHHAGHGVAGAAVRPDQVADAVGEDQEGHADEGDACVLLGVGHHLVGGAENPQQRGEEHLSQKEVKQPRRGHEDDPVPGNFRRLLRVFPSQAEGEPCRAAHADQQRDGQADGGQGVGHIGGSVAQVSHALADENLIHNVVQGANQGCRDAGNGKASQQFGDFFLT